MTDDEKAPALVWMVIYTWAVFVYHLMRLIWLWIMEYKKGLGL